MPRWYHPSWGVALTVLALFPGARAIAESPHDAAFARRIRPLLVKYCRECHSGGQPEGDLNLDRFATVADVRTATRVWQKINEMLDGEQMPPQSAAQPSDAERAEFRSWVRAHLTAEAKVHAGDPGRVMLRRLSNAEYTYTLRDLTGLAALDPTREFPADGAAGEGFTNSGDALVMSPALLTKFLDAAKGIAAHAVLLPDGLRFSPHVTRQDWTNETLDQIRELYRKYTDDGGSKVALQGLVWEGKEGGRLPVEKYVAATLMERDAIRAGRRTLAAIAADHGLSAKYLSAVWAMFTGNGPSSVLDDLRTRWRAAGPNDASAITAEIVRWQNAVWRFRTVGHIGKLNGPKSWLEPVDPLTTRHAIRWKVPETDAADVTLYLATSDCGDTGSDAVVWERPRFVAPGRPDLLLKDVRAVSRARIAHRSRVLADTTKYLLAADEAARARGSADIRSLAKAHSLDVDALSGWLDVLGIGTNGPVRLTGHFRAKQTDIAGHPFVSGWASPDLPSIVANSSQQLVRIPGNLKGRGVAVHPTPTLHAVVGWQSPVAGTAQVVAKVQHAHPACGNGVTWAVEVRRGSTRQRLASGTAQGQTPPAIDTLRVPVSTGDVVSVVIGPRDGNHACDLTVIDLAISIGDRTWELTKDVSGNLLDGNPHADRHGNAGVWHFYSEPVSGGPSPVAVIPPGSALSKWQAEAPGSRRVEAAVAVQRWLTTPPREDAAFHRQLTALGGPLFSHTSQDKVATPRAVGDPWGVDPTRFGRHPNGEGSVDEASLCVIAPEVIPVTVPADLIAGYEFVTTGVIHASTREQGTAQLRVTTEKPATAGLIPGVPILTAESSPARSRMATGLDAFRALFPIAVCYARVVPVDEVVTLTQYYREDHHLVRLMLTESEAEVLNRLWDELHYVSRDALTQVDAFRQLMEYASQDANPSVFEPLRNPTLAAAEAYRRRLIDTEPGHRNAVLRFADRAYRRPLVPEERDELTTLYRTLRTQGLPHDDAIRLMLARVLVAPAFLYKLEQPGSGTAATPITDWELASRLSYFLGSSAPDEELRALAAAGRLRDPDVLAAQARRMLADDRVRRLAIEFGCQWLHIRGFDQMNEKSERHFPTFAGLRASMNEESVLFFTDLFRSDRTLRSILDSDATFLNEALAKHYGIPGVTGDHWRRVEGVRKYGRGGILTLATTLATQSGASRTSPILRGNWVYEVLLGERLPRPPKGVPPLPDDASATDGLTVRQLVARHTADPKCAACHVRIDVYGFALEAYDAIGRRRDTEQAGRPLDTRATTTDGTTLEGIDGLRAFLLTKRNAAFERQFCRKLLGYALGRSVQLSDEPLLDEIHDALEKHGGKVSVVIEAIVRSQQFREIRGREYPADE